MKVEGDIGGLSSRFGLYGMDEELESALQGWGSLIEMLSPEVDVGARIVVGQGRTEVIVRSEKYLDVAVSCIISTPVDLSRESDQCPVDRAVSVLQEKVMSVIQLDAGMQLPTYFATPAKPGSAERIAHAKFSIGTQASTRIASACSLIGTIQVMTDQLADALATRLEETA